MVEQLTLSDGRNFDYLISGDSQGIPIFFIHGQPGSYVPPAGFPEACQSKGLKCITMSRAGYGGSSRKVGRHVVDMVADIEELKTHLGLTSCYVAGWSAGGPHALACGAQLSGCIAVLSVAACAPYDLFIADGLDYLEGQGEDNVEEQKISLQGEAALQEYCKGVRAEMLGANSTSLVDAMSSLLPPIDKQAILDNPHLGQNLVDSFHEGFRINSDGYVDDGLAFNLDWGFRLQDIEVPVFVWQGSEDMMVPFSHGQWIAKKLPSEVLEERLIEGEGHISIFLGRVEKMLDELLSVKTR